MADYDSNWREIPDPVPVAVPHDWKRPLSLHEQIKRFIRQEYSAQQAELGQESFEEADDFEVDEDPDPLSQYEIPEAAPEWPGGVKDRDADPPMDPSKEAAVSSPSASEVPSKG